MGIRCDNMRSPGLCAWTFMCVCVCVSVCGSIAWTTCATTCFSVGLTRTGLCSPRRYGACLASAVAPHLTPNVCHVMPQVAWIAHTATKAAADLVLDTNLKNGHTSTTDALWAGVPVVSMLGLRMGSRVAVALLRASRAPHTEAMSHRDYEDLCVAVLHGSEGGSPRNLCICAV